MEKGRFWSKTPSQFSKGTDTFPVRIWSSGSRSASLTRTLEEEAKKHDKGVFGAHCPVTGPYKINLKALDVLLKELKTVTFPDMTTWKAQYLAHVKTSGTHPLFDSNQVVDSSGNPYRKAEAAALNNFPSASVTTGDATADRTGSASVSQPQVNNGKATKKNQYQ